MSNKTMKQRIALVAASALTAGFLSVVATPVANAAVPVVEHFTLGTTASTTGAAAITAVGATTADGDMTSTGIVVVASADLSAAATTAGVILPTAQLSFSWLSAAKTGLVVTGGVITKATGVVATTVASAIPISSSLTSAYNANLAVTPIGTGQAIVATNAAVGSNMTVAVYSGANVSASTPSAGTLIGLYTFTVAAAGTAGIPDVAQSAVYIQAPIAKTAAIAGANTYDSSSTVQNGQAGVAYVLLKDAYKVAVSTGGTVTATATNGATVKIDNTTSTAVPYTATSSFDSMTNTDGVMYYVVNQPVANTAGSSTVTFTYAGVVIGTKTFNWVGDIATLTVTGDSATSFINGYALAAPIIAPNLGSAGNVVYIAKDAAGNAVTLTAQPTVDSAAGSMVGATVYNLGVKANGGEFQSSAVGYGYTTMAWGTATALYGAGTYRLKLTNGAGASIYSAVQTVKVSNGGPNSFVASWDKASYSPGDIGTLTITVKDVYGNPVGAGTALPGLTAGLLVSAGLTAIGTACVDASYTDSLGVKTCKFAAGNTEGSYSYSIDLDTVTAQLPTLGAVKVASSTATVSNAQVLQSIVALIASINKQIQALQKLILKR